MAIIQGLGGPNRLSERTRGMDSRLIFRPLRLFQTVTQMISLEGLLDFPTSVTAGGFKQSICLEKLEELSKRSPYRKPTQVGWRKCAKVNE